MQPEAPRYSPVPEEVIANVTSERRYLIKLMNDTRAKQAKLPARRSDFVQGVWDCYEQQIAEAQRKLRAMTSAERDARRDLAREQQQ